MTDPHQRTAQRTARSGGALRLLRAAVFAAVCVVLAGAGHTLAACDAVPLWTLGAGFLAVLVVAAPLAGRARSLAGIATLLTVGQAVLHTLFGLGQHSAASGGAASAASRAADAALVERAARLLCGAAAAPLSPARAQQILVDARIYPGGGTGTSAVHHASEGMGGPGVTASPFPTPMSMALLPSLPMLLGHVLAAVGAGWLLRHGDAALLRLTELSAQGVAEGALVRALRAALALARALLAGLPGAPETGPRPPRAAPPVPPLPSAGALQHSVIRRGPPAAAPLVLAA
ncbi:hypothetical protein ACFVWS_11005 [Streptomyces sp. NPDC058204]|uniref:hypothetical protein n=2 Tax=unclassified Streptomyces TaxID=2593676 RepID=UPI0036E85BAF